MAINLRINEMIRAKEVRVIDAEGKQLGILSIREALALAQEEGVDLVEVAPNGVPPVCRILDYGKYKYRFSKKSQEAKKKQKTIQVKEVKLRPKTEEHDYQFKMRNIRRFLSEGNKAKITMVFRGRELAHIEIGKKLLDRLAEEVSDVAALEQKPKQEGQNMTMVLMPKS
ncbi:MAG: translation initiation factor IF-3 [Candidatus Tectomicrobia bacterium]|nr:translation initiation factor IF-3 [Candidatus Tectomicrobia bacterium]